MDMQKILERVKLITGDDRETLLAALCADALRETESRLNCTEEEKEASEDALCAAAAALAVYRLVLLDAAQSPDSVTAGGVRAQYRYNCTQAEAYLRESLRAVSSLMQDDSFFFGGFCV